GLVLKNITVNNFTGMDGQGVETYGVDNYNIDNIRGNNLRGCALVLNHSNNGTIGSVYGYRCNNGGGYAALRYVNDCDGAKVAYVYARECGRGFVSGRCYNIDVAKVDIEGSTSDAILITGGSTKVRVLGGTYKGVAINHYTNPVNNGNVINAVKLD
ncbi:MAG: hypothetical protein QG594_495, partial [Bacteroidota bacterium]|nr:hypothetical protein [Bacteroidota bacterium]